MDRILIGKSPTKPEHLHLRYANRHGLVTGASGTGKTITLQVLAEGFSRAGVPVFAADVKGDLSGVAAPGQGLAPFRRRADELGIEYRPERFPVVFWDIFGEQGHRVRASAEEIGPLLLSRLLNLNDTQAGVLNVAFRVAAEQGWPVIDLKDMRSLLNHVSDNAAEIGARFGGVARASIAAVQRQLLMFESQRGCQFLGSPTFDIADLMHTDESGRGHINILMAEKLMANPRLYAIFLLWLMSELFDQLPEVGDLDRPKLVFFFDEAHLLFNGAPRPLLEAVERMVRLIRSKGVGIYFVTQSPIDVPEVVLAQLGNRIQHALRAFTPRDQRAVRAAAETFRQNPAFDTSRAILEVGVGEALVSTVEGRGSPSMVERTLIAPPAGQVGPLSEEQRRAIIDSCRMGAKYGAEQDPESAYEILALRAAAAEPAEPAGRNGLTPGQAVAREVTRTVVSRLAGQIATNIGRTVGGSMGASLGQSIVKGTLSGLLKA